MKRGDFLKRLAAASIVGVAPSSFEKPEVKRVKRVERFEWPVLDHADLPPLNLKPILERLVKAYE